MSDYQPAKRGDLVAIVQTHHSYVIGKGSQERTTVELAMVTSITRDGQVKAYQPVSSEQSYQLRPRLGTRVLVVPASKVNVQAAYEAAKLHVYAGHGYPKPFDSVDEAREFVKPFAVA